MNERMNKWMTDCMNDRLDEWTDATHEWINDGWMDGDLGHFYAHSRTGLGLDIYLENIILD